jgi:hypothetical protein
VLEVEQLLKEFKDVFAWTYKDLKGHSDDILGARMLWKPKEARILKNFIDQPVSFGKHSRVKNVMTRC